MKSRTKFPRWVPIFIVVILWMLLTACALGWLATQEDSPAGEENVVQMTQPAVQTTGENGSIARQHLEALTEIGARWPGTAQETEARQYIISCLDQLGYAPEVQNFSATSDEGEEVDPANIIAVKDGESSEVIVVGAHYDSSDEGLGTDDNGSGVAVLLEAAEQVANKTTPYTIYFIAFGAEETGLLGSYEFLDALSNDEIANIILYINMDSLCAGDITYIYSGNDPTALNWAVDWADSSGYDLEPIPNADLSTDGEGTADYAAFDDADIPWVYFEATNWELGDEDGYTQVDPRFGDDGAIIHTQYDNLAYLDETFPGRVNQHLDVYVSVLLAYLTDYP